MPRFVADPNYQSNKIRDFARMMSIFQQQKDRRNAQEFERDRETMDQIMKAAAQGYGSPKAQAFVDRMAEKYGDQWSALYKAATETGTGVKEARELAKRLYMRGSGAGPQMKTIGQATGMAPAPAAAPTIPQSNGPPPLTMAQAQALGLDVDDPRYFGYQRQVGVPDLPAQYRVPYIAGQNPEIMQAWRYKQELETTPDEETRFELERGRQRISQQQADTAAAQEGRLREGGGTRKKPTSIADDVKAVISDFDKRSQYKPTDEREGMLSGRPKMMLQSQSAAIEAELDNAGLQGAQRENVKSQIATAWVTLTSSGFNQKQAFEIITQQKLEAAMELLARKLKPQAIYEALFGSK